MSGSSHPARTTINIETAQRIRSSQKKSGARRAGTPLVVVLVRDDLTAKIVEQNVLGLHAQIV